jgi:hypothetical protein
VLQARFQGGAMLWGRVSQGRAFFTCVALDLTTKANLVFATQSPVGAEGSFFSTLIRLAATSSWMRRTIRAPRSASRS